MGFSAPTIAGRLIPEKILVYGPPKVGKSRAVLSIARQHTITGSDAHFHVINTEAGYLKMMAYEFGGLTNVSVHDVASWQNVKAAKRTILESGLRPHDWIVVDLASALWQMVQDFYVGEVFPDQGVNDLGDFFMAARGGDLDLEGWKDWSVINKLYQSIIYPLIVRAPCHVFIVSAEKELMDTSRSGKVGESAQSRQMYGKVGAKPHGQKDLAYQCDSIIYMERNPKGEYLMHTVGDREREFMTAQPVGEFWATYLMAKGGWTIQG